MSIYLLIDSVSKVDDDGWQIFSNKWRYEYMISRGLNVFMTFSYRYENDIILIKDCKLDVTHDIMSTMFWNVGWICDDECVIDLKSKEIISDIEFLQVNLNNTHNKKYDLIHWIPFSYKNGPTYVDVIDFFFNRKLNI